MYLDNGFRFRVINNIKYLSLLLPKILLLIKFSVSKLIAALYQTNLSVQNLLSTQKFNALYIEACTDIRS